MPSVRDLILRLQGEDVSAGRTVDELERKLSRMAHEPHTAELGLDTTQGELTAKRFEATLDKIGSETRSAKVKLEATKGFVDLKRFRYELDQIGNSKTAAEVAAHTSSAQRALDEIQLRLDRIDSETHSAKIEAQTAGARFEVGLFSRELDEVGQKHETAKVDVDGVALALAQVALLRREIAALGRDRATASVGVNRRGGPGSPIDPLGLAPGGGAPNLFSSRAQTQLLGAALPILPTVGASLVSGLAGAGALGVAAGGVATPILGLLGGVISSFTGATTAATKYHAAQQAVTSASDSLQNAEASASQAETSLEQARTAAADQIRNDLQTAYDGLRSAKEAVVTSDYTETNAEEALTQARRDARRAIVDEGNAARDSTLSHRAAVLGLQRAQEQLSSLEATGGGGLDLAEARLSVAQAEQQVKETRIASTRAHSDARRAEHRGVSGAPSVVQARQAVQQATQGQSDAAHKLAEAEQAVNRAEAESVNTAPSVVSAEAAVAASHKAVADAAQKLEYAQTKAARAQHKFDLTQSARDASLAWTHLRHDIEPVVDLIDKGIGGALVLIRDLIAHIMPELRGLGAALSAGFQEFGASLDTGRMQELLGRLVDGASQVVRILTPTFIAFFRVLTNIAVAALPDLLDLLRSIRTEVQGWVKDTNDIGKTRDTIHSLVGDFRAWLGLLGAIGDLFIALFVSNRGAAAMGTDAVKDFTRTIRGWVEYLNTHRRQVNGFWHNLLTLFKDLAELLSAGFGAGIPVLTTLASAAAPLATAIKSIVDALNSLKIGNISALTVLLGAMAAGKIGNIAKGIGGAFAGSALGRILLGGGTKTAEKAALSTGEKVAIGGGAAGGGAASKGILEAIGSRLPEGAKLGTGFGALSAVTYQSLFGKPGSFLGPGIAGFVPSGKQTRRQIENQLDIQRRYRTESLAVLEQQRQKMDGINAQMWEEDPQKRQSAGQRALRRGARRTAQILQDAIKGEHLGETFAKSIAEHPGDIKGALKKIHDDFVNSNTDVQDSTIRFSKRYIKQYAEMFGLNHKQTEKALKALEDLQTRSFNHQTRQVAAFGSGFYGILKSTFSAGFGTVQNFLGSKGMTGAINKLLTGVGSQKKLQFNAVTAANLAVTVPNLIGTVLGSGGHPGAAYGGMIPGYSRTDDRLIGVRGGEAVLRPEDHVPFVDRAIRVATRGRMAGLGDLFNRTGAAPGKGTHFAKGGTATKLGDYAYPFGKGFGISQYDQGIDGGPAGIPIYAIGDGRVTHPNYNPFGYGSTTSGLVYTMDHPPAGYSPSSPYVYVFEGFNPTATGRIKAGQQIGVTTGGIETGFSGDSAGSLTLSQLKGEDTDNRHNAALYPMGLPSAQSFTQFINDVRAGHPIAQGAAGGAAAAIRLLKRILIKGPDGGLKDSMQGIADHARDEANKFLRKQEQKAAPGGSAIPGSKLARSIKGLPQSLIPYNRIWPHAGGYDNAGWAALPQMPVKKIEELAEWAGMPGVSMAQISHGEADYKPGSLELGRGSGPDPSRPRGVGLWAITPPYGDGLKYPGGTLSGDYSPEMYNPVWNALVASQMYRAAGGLSPWHGTRYLQGDNLHYHGPRRALGGFVPGFARGGITLIPEGGTTAKQLARAQAWADSSLLPFKDTLGLKFGHGPTSSGGLGDWSPGMLEMAAFSPRRTLLHELGHDFDYLHLNDTIRGRMLKLWNIHKWWGPEGGSGREGGEYFADAFSQLARTPVSGIKGHHLAYSTGAGLTTPTKLLEIREMIMSAMHSGVPKLRAGIRNFAGGFAVMGEDGGAELAHMATGADVYSSREAKAILDAAARGAAHDGGHDRMPDLEVHILGDIVSDHHDPVQAFIGDQRVEAHIRGIAAEELGDQGNHDYRMSRHSR